MSTELFPKLRSCFNFPSDTFSSLQLSPYRKKKDISYLPVIEVDHGKAPSIFTLSFFLSFFHIPPPSLFLTHKSTPLLNSISCWLNISMFSACALIDIGIYIVVLFPPLRQLDSMSMNICSYSVLFCFFFLMEDHCDRKGQQMSLDVCVESTLSKYYSATLLLGKSSSILCGSHAAAGKECRLFLSGASFCA